MGSGWRVHTCDEIGWSLASVAPWLWVKVTGCLSLCLSTYKISQNVTLPILAVWRWLGSSYTLSSPKSWRKVQLFLLHISITFIFGTHLLLKRLNTVATEKWVTFKSMPQKVKSSPSFHCPAASPKWARRWATVIKFWFHLSEPGSPFAFFFFVFKWATIVRMQEISVNKLKISCHRWFF